MTISENSKEKFWEGHNDIAQDQNILTELSQQEGFDPGSAYARYVAAQKNFPTDIEDSVWRALKPNRNLVLQKWMVAASLVLIIGVAGLFMHLYKSHKQSMQFREVGSNMLLEFDYMYENMRANVVYEDEAIVIFGGFAAQVAPAQNGMYGKVSAQIKPTASGILVFDHQGKLLFGANQNPLVYINGYESSFDHRQAFRNINAACISSVIVLNNPGDCASANNENGVIEVCLKGQEKQVFSLCDGVLFFGQNGHIQSVDIYADQAPKLLLNCSEQPLARIEDIEPEKVKSIQLTANPRNCNGERKGEYLVVEL